jgi:phage-related protein
MGVPVTNFLARRHEFGIRRGFEFIKYDKSIVVISEVPRIWNVDFFVGDEGSRPVEIWLDGLPEEVRGKVIARIDLLKNGGKTLDFPYTSQIEGKLREIRLRMGKIRYRVLYFFDDNRTAILLHGFTKNTASVEEADKKTGRSRMAKHEARLEAKGLTKAGKSDRTRGREK